MRVLNGNTITMKKREKWPYEAPTAQVVGLVQEGMICYSGEGTEDVTTSANSYGEESFE